MREADRMAEDYSQIKGIKVEVLQQGSVAYGKEV